MDPVEIDDQVANMELLSGGQNRGSLGRSTVAPSIKRLNRRAEKDDPQPESPAEVGPTMTSRVGRRSDNSRVIHLDDSSRCDKASSLTVARSLTVPAAIEAVILCRE